MNTSNLLAMFAPGIQEMIVIFLMVLLLFGAKKIPQLARGIGKAQGEFTNAKNEFEKEIKQGEKEAATEWDKSISKAGS